MYLEYFTSPWRLALHTTHMVEWRPDRGKEGDPGRVFDSRSEFVQISENPFKGGYETLPTLCVRYGIP
jgi:hypothetical protein